MHLQAPRDDSRESLGLASIASTSRIEAFINPFSDQEHGGLRGANGVDSTSTDFLGCVVYGVDAVQVKFPAHSRNPGIQCGNCVRPGTGLDLKNDHPIEPRVTPLDVRSLLVKPKHTSSPKCRSVAI